MKPKMMLSISMVLIIYSFIHFYIGWHVHVFLHYSLQWQAPVNIGVLVGVLALSYPIGRLAHRWIPYGASVFLKVIGSYWMAVMMYSILLLPLADLVAGVIAISGAMEKAAYIPLLGTIVTAIIALILLCGSWNAWQPVIRRHEISIAKQAGHSGRQSLRMAVASDLHLGSIVGNAHIERLLAQMEKIKPDIILLPGDVLDDEIEPFLRHHMADTLKKLHAPLGVYAVLGNHEYYGGGMQRYLETMREIGVHVLLDEVVMVADSFYVAGRKDQTAAIRRIEGPAGGGRQSAAELIGGIADNGYPIIMMDHQPQQLGQAEKAGADILLSGHTHRGQMSPNHWITRRIFELDWGYLRKGSLHAFVSSGFGTWGPPIRIGSRCEVLQIDVRFDKV